MAHHETEASSPEEARFNSYVTRGDDFKKIELYQYAIIWYQRALEMNRDNQNVQIKIDECRSKFSNDGRKIWAIVAIAACIVGIAWVWSCSM